MTPPVAPAIETPAAPATPAEDAKPKTIAEALAAARDQLLPKEGAEAPAGEGAPPAAETPAEGEKPAVETPADGAEGEKVPEGAAETEGEKPDEKTPEGEAPAEIIVEIPARRPGEKPLQLAVESQEVADRINQNTKSGMRRDEFNHAMTRVGQKEQELDLVEQYLHLDPAGFLVDRVRPEVRVEVAKQLLAIPEVFDQVIQEVESWQANPDVQGRRQAELAKDRSERRIAAEREMATLAAQRREATVIRDTVVAITPADMSEEELGLFQDDCLTDIQRWARAHPEVQHLRPEQVIGILEPRLRHYRLDPKAAQAALSSGQPFRRPTAASPTPAPVPGTSDLEAARTTGAKLRQAGEQRREVAAVPGAGAGARPAKLEPPPKQTVTERVQWLKSLIGR